MAKGEKNGSLAEQLAAAQSAGRISPENRKEKQEGLPALFKISVPDGKIVEGEYIPAGGMTVSREWLDKNGAKGIVGVLRTADVISGLQGNKGVLGSIDAGSERGKEDKDNAGSTLKRVRDKLDQALKAYKEGDDESYSAVLRAAAEFNKAVHDVYTAVQKGERVPAPALKNETDKIEASQDTEKNVEKKEKELEGLFDEHNVSKTARENLLSILNRNKDKQHYQSLLNEYIQKLKNTKTRGILLRNAAHSTESNHVSRKDKEENTLATEEEVAPPQKQEDVTKTVESGDIDVDYELEVTVGEEPATVHIVLDDPFDTVHELKAFSGLERHDGEYTGVAKYIEQHNLKKNELKNWEKFTRVLQTLVNAIMSFRRNTARSSTEGKVREDLEEKIKEYKETLGDLLEEIESKQSTESESTPASGGEEEKKEVVEKERVEGQQSSAKKAFSSRQGPFPIADDYDESFLDKSIVTVDGYEYKKVTPKTEGGAQQQKKQEELNDYEHEERIMDEALFVAPETETSLPDIFKDVEQKRAHLAELTEERNPVFLGTLESHRTISEAISYILAHEQAELDEQTKKEIRERYQTVLDNYDQAIDDLIPDENEGQSDETEVAKQEEEKEETPLRKAYLEQKEARKAYYDALKSEKKHFQSIRGIRALTGEGMTDELKGLKDDFEEKYQAYLETRSNVYQQEERGTDKEGESLEKRELNINRRVEREALMLLHAQAESEPGKIGRVMQKVGSVLNKTPKWARMLGRYTVAGGIGAATAGVVGAGMGIGRMLFGTAVGAGVGMGTDAVFDKLSTQKKRENLEQVKSQQGETAREGRLGLSEINKAIEARRKAHADVYTSEKRKRYTSISAAVAAGFATGMSLSEILEKTQDFSAPEAQKGATGAWSDTKPSAPAEAEKATGSITLDEKGNVVPKATDASIGTVSEPDVEFEKPSPVTPEQNVDVGGETGPVQEELNENQSVKGGVVPDSGTQSFEGDGAGFIEPITVEKGDTLWDHMEKTFADQLSGLSSSQQDVVLDRMVDYLEENPELGNRVGVGPDPHLIHPGDTLDLNPLTELIDKYAAEAQGSGTESGSGTTPPLPPERPEAVPPLPPERPEAPLSPTGSETTPETAGVVSSRPDFESFPQKGEPPSDAYINGGEGNAVVTGGAGTEQLAEAAPLEIDGQPVTPEAYADQAPGLYLESVFPSEGGFWGIGGTEGGINAPEWIEMSQTPAENFLDPGAFERMNVGTPEQRTAIAELVGDLQAQSGIEPSNSQSVAEYLGIALAEAVTKGYRLPNVG